MHMVLDAADLEEGNSQIPEDASRIGKEVLSDLRCEKGMSLVLKTTCTRMLERDWGMGRILSPFQGFRGGRSSGFQGVALRFNLAARWAWERHQSADVRSAMI